MLHIVKQYWQFTSRFTLTSIWLQAIEGKYSSLGATHGPGFEVQFEGDTIRLEIDEDGVCLQNGWEILPLIAPVVSLKIMIMVGDVVHRFLVFKKQIEKQQVDGFQPWKKVPYCRLKVTFDKDRKPVELKHKVKLLGVKGSHNFFTITCVAEGKSIFCPNMNARRMASTLVVTNTSILFFLSVV